MNFFFRTATGVFNYAINKRIFFFSSGSKINFLHVQLLWIKI